MTNQLVRLARCLVVPGSILLAAALAASKLPAVPHSQLALIPYMPYVVLGLGLGLSWRFNRSRVFFALAVLLLAYTGLHHGVPHHFARAMPQRALFNSIGLLLPLTLTTVCLLKERGIFTTHGLARFAALLAPATAAVALSGWWDADLVSLLRAELLKAGPFKWTPVPPLVMGAFTLGFILLLIQLAWQRTALDGAVLGALAAAAGTFYAGAQVMSAAVFITAGGLMLILGVIQDGYRKAYLDELTGLPGRRALEEELLKLSGRYVIAMVDVDRFKKLNDTYGHDVGDHALRMVASQLRRITGGGRSFRYGGEEFTILFSSKSVAEAVAHLDDLREHIAESPFAVRRRCRRKAASIRSTRSGSSRRTFITVSIGVAERNGRLVTPEKVLKAADRALYRAKRGGRNRVCY